MCLYKVSPLDDTMTLVTKVQMNPKTKGILPVLEGLLQTQNSGWICKPFSEPGSRFPQMPAEV